MKQQLLQILYAFLGSYGFALIFNQKPVKRALPAALTGAMAWSVYLITLNFGFRPFTSALTASFAACFVAELLARAFKAPATVFYAAAEIPLIPGGSLFYTARAAITKNAEEFPKYALETAESALGIAVGIAAVTAIFHIYAKSALGIKNKKQNNKSPGGPKQ